MTTTLARKLMPILALLVVLTVLPAQAQSYGVGARVGLNTDFSDDFDAGDVDDLLLEAQFVVELSRYVLLRGRIGRIDVDGGDTEPDSEIMRYTVDVEYQFKNVYYTSGFFVGGGWYTFDDDGVAPSWHDGDDHFGYYAGINGWFELRPGFSLVPELMIESIEQGDRRTLATVSVGAVYRF